MATNEDLEEIYLERAIYLLNTDDILEQILEDRYNVMPFIPNRSRDKSRKWH